MINQTIHKQLTIVSCVEIGVIPSSLMNEVFKKCANTHSMLPNTKIGMDSMNVNLNVLIISFFIKKYRTYIKKIDDAVVDFGSKSHAKRPNKLIV
jgi:hypothetical protein